jgi:hypothetical protein
VSASCKDDQRHRSGTAFLLTALLRISNEILTITTRACIDLNGSNYFGDLSSLEDVTNGLAASTEVPRWTIHSWEYDALPSCVLAVFMISTDPSFKPLSEIT